MSDDAVDASNPRGKIALVLSGGGARGAYEAGVLRYLARGLPRDEGVVPRFDVVCGTSVGALHACFVAATIDDLPESVERLVARWSELRPDHLLHLQASEALKIVWSIFAGQRSRSDEPNVHGGDRRGGLIDPHALERFVRETVPFDRIGPNIEERKLSALSVSTTRVADGETTVFVDSADPLPRWSRDPHVHAEAARITAEHALASAAIPLMFPAVAIDGAFHVDGGMRQNTPLSPGIRLGAERALVVTLRPPPARLVTEAVAVRREEALPSPFFLAGKMLNALLIDRIDSDLDRLRQGNAIIDAGVKAYGSGFVETMNAARGGLPLRRVDVEVVRPTVDLGALAAAHVRGPSFEHNSIAGRVLKRLADADDADEADLLSYVLFDGAYAQQLMELGEADARSRSHALAELFRPGK